MKCLSAVEIEKVGGWQGVGLLVPAVWLQSASRLSVDVSLVPSSAVAAFQPAPLILLPATASHPCIAFLLLLLLLVAALHHTLAHTLPHSPQQANAAKRDKNAQLRSNFSASLDDFTFNRFSGSFSDHRAGSLDPSAALLSPRSTATLVGQSFTTDDINTSSSSHSGGMGGMGGDLNPGLSALMINGGSGSNSGSGGAGGGAGGFGSPHAAGTPTEVMSPKSGGGRAAERSLAASSVPLTGVYGGDATGGLSAPASAFSGAAAAPEGQQFSMVRDKYMVFCLDSSDTIDRLGRLLARKGKVLLGLAKAGHSVGLAVASAFSLNDTIELLRGKGISVADLDFAVTSCGAEVWYCGEAAAAGSSSKRNGVDGCVMDDAYDMRLDLNWDALSVRRVLSQCMGQLLRQLPGIAAGNSSLFAASKSSAVANSMSRRASLSLALPRYKIQMEPSGAAHHLLVTLEPHDGLALPAAAPAGDDSAAPADNSKQYQQPALSAQDVETLIARIKRRLRRSGLRTQVRYGCWLLLSNSSGSVCAGG